MGLLRGKQFYSLTVFLTAYTVTGIAFQTA